jgi:hypothetical protein
MHTLGVTHGQRDRARLRAARLVGRRIVRGAQVAVAGRAAHRRSGRGPLRLDGPVAVGGGAVRCALRPGAGEPVARPALLGHRRRLLEQRLAQVREALTRLGPDATPRQVVELVYADVDQVLWPAAELSVRAQLDHLRS